MWRILAAEHIVHIRWPCDLHVRKGVKLRKLSARRPIPGAALNTKPFVQKHAEVNECGLLEHCGLRNSTTVWQMVGNDNE